MFLGSNGPKYREEEYDEVWEAWGESGDHALKDFEDLLLVANSMGASLSEEEAGIYIERIGCAMPRKIWKIMISTKKEVLLRAICIADTVISYGVNSLVTTERKNSPIPKEDLKDLLDWFGVPRQTGMPKVSKVIARNRIFVIRSILKNS